MINLGNASPVSVLELIEKLAGALKLVPRLRFVPRPPGEMNVTYAAIGRAADRWAWQPRVTLDEGIAEFAQWLRWERRTMPRRVLDVLARGRLPARMRNLVRLAQMPSA